MSWFKQGWQDDTSPSMSTSQKNYIDALVMERDLDLNEIVQHLFGSGGDKDTLTMKQASEVIDYIQDNTKRPRR